jgi:hypothetical protein
VPLLHSTGEPLLARLAGLNSVSVSALLYLLFDSAGTANKTCGTSVALRGWCATQKFCNTHLKSESGKIMSSERMKRIAESKALAAEYDSYTGTELGKLPAAEYARLRAGKVALGELGPQSGTRPGLVIKHYEQIPAGPLTDQELALMLKYPVSELEIFYVTNGDKRNPDNTHILAKKLSDGPDAVNGFVPRSAAEQLEIRNAAILHGVIQGTVRFPVQEVKPVVADDERVNAGPLGALAGLSPDTRVSVRQYNDLLAADARRLAARSPEQVAADRVVELRREADRVQASIEKAKE